MGKNIITNSASEEKMKLVKNGAFDIDKKEVMFLEPEKTVPGHWEILTGVLMYFLTCCHCKMLQAHLEYTLYFKIKFVI